MAPRKKLGLTIPTDPRLKGFDGPFLNGGNALFSINPSQAQAPAPATSSSSQSPSTPPLLSPTSKSSSYNRPLTPHPSPPPPPPPPPQLEPSETEELQRLVHAPPTWKGKKKLSKQLSMCETARDMAWERRRRRQMMSQERRQKSAADAEDITDEDLHELKGCIELGFGFNEQHGQKLCNTLPALDLYFAVNRKLSPSPVSTPRGGGKESSASSSTGSLESRSASFESPKADEPWRICGPGDDPQQVKTKLRHWAQAVACSVIQSS